MIISISGTPGSGKSTLAKKLAKKLGYAHVSMGDVRREMARERNMTVGELNRIGETERWTDAEADEKLQDLARKNDNIIFDSRTAYHFIPTSVKIFISVDERIGAKRIFGSLKRNPRKRNEDTNLHSIDDVLESNRRRKASDQKRYQQYYGIDCFDLSQYDYVLDTSRLTPKQGLERIYAYVLNLKRSEKAA